MDWTPWTDSPVRDLFSTRATCNEASSTSGDSAAAVRCWLHLGSPVVLSLKIKQAEVCTAVTSTSAFGLDANARTLPKLRTLSPRQTRTFAIRGAKASATLANIDRDIDHTAVTPPLLHEVINHERWALVLGTVRAATAYTLHTLRHYLHPA